jgi:thiamine pyrophosphokinase
MVNNTVIALNGQLKAKKKNYINLICRKDPFFIAADGGANLLRALGFLPDIIIGDLDSLSKKEVLGYQENDVEILKYPAEKNETDGELALKYCSDHGFDKITIIGATGERLDQQLANIFLLEYALEKNINAIIREPGLEIGIVNKNKIIKNKREWGLSLIPLDFTVKSVTITGCKYNVKSKSLKRYQTRGISNVIKKNTVKISHGKGRLLYILDKNMYTPC